MSDTIIKTYFTLDESEVGRRFVFWTPDFPEGTPLGFASKLENIGIVEKHDCQLKNKTEVIALSEPTEAHHAIMGPLLVTKILAHTIMWVPTFALHEIPEG
jgi:hypothetical protein